MYKIIEIIKTQYFSMQYSELKHNWVRSNLLNDYQVKVT